jgi:hypothetical protein
MRGEFRDIVGPMVIPEQVLFAPDAMPKKIEPTPEQIAKVVVAKLSSPVGTPDKAEITLRLSLPRAVLDRLMARLSRESYPGLAAWGEAVLEREAKH